MDAALILIDDDFDDIPTVEIPIQTMHDLVFGAGTSEGHAPIGPDRVTRNMLATWDEDEHTDVENYSDGVPVPVGLGWDKTKIAGSK